MLWLRGILPVIGHILNCIKKLNVVISIIRLNWQIGLDHSEFLGNLRLDTKRERDWRVKL